MDITELEGLSDVREDVVTPVRRHSVACLAKFDAEPEPEPVGIFSRILQSFFGVGVANNLGGDVGAQGGLNATPGDLTPSADMVVSVMHTKEAACQDALPLLDGSEAQLPDAEVVPARPEVPEAKVAALGDAAGQYFVPPSDTLSGRGSSVTTEVSLSDFDLIKVLGKGSFGKVLLVEKVDTCTTFAMKVLKKSKLRRQKQVERTKTERRVLEIAADSPFIMSMSYAFQTDERLYIVLEYCTGGELFFHLSRYRKFPEHVARFYTAELVCALEFLHEHGIIYRDMKPENVLLDAEGHVKLGDFGLAKDNIWQATTGARSICGTPEYMAPEVLNKQGHGSAVDWWGLGMILYEMLTGLPPWYTKDRQKLFQRLRYAPLRIPSTMSSECASCVSGLLCRDPAQRLGAKTSQEIRDHSFFSPACGFDWMLLEARKISPPINPMDGLNRNQAHDAKTTTANFDPQFLALAIETDCEDEPSPNAGARVETTNDMNAAAGRFAHFEGFSFAGSGSAGDLDVDLGSGDLADSPRSSELSASEGGGAPDKKPAAVAEIGGLSSMVGHEASPQVQDAPSSPPPPVVAKPEAEQPRMSPSTLWGAFRAVGNSSARKSTPADSAASSALASPNSEVVESPMPPKPPAGGGH